MDCKIYLITDCDNRNYVGRTIQTLNRRLYCHKNNDRFGRSCSSQLLNLNDCKIELLEKCNIKDSKERERYWINKIDCVNIRNRYSNKKEYGKVYDKSEKMLKYRKDYKKNIRDYRYSWGGDLRYENNNLLKIDPKLFS